MKRKVNRVGQNTLTVSLPSKWAKKYEINVGDELTLQESGNSLVINPATGSKEKREISFDLDETQGFMLRLLCGPYLKGYTAIKIKYSKHKDYLKIQKGLRYLIGFEIVSQGKNFVKLEEISSGTDTNFKNIIIRLFHILKSFLDEIHNYLQNPYENIEDLHDIELSCDRLALYCKRLVNRNLIFGKPFENTGLYHIVCLIEQAADELRHVVEYFTTNKTKYKYDKKLAPIFQKLDKIIDVTLKKVNNYMNERDYKTQAKHARHQKKLRAEIKENPNIFLKLNKESVYVYWRLVNINEHLQHMSEELF